MKTIEQLTQELEAVKKERDELAWHNTRIITVENQRDEAVKLLQTLSDKAESSGIMPYAEEAEINKFLSRLSSGETKHPEIPDSSTVSTWISVEDRMPEVGEIVLCYSNNGNSGYISSYELKEYKGDENNTFSNWTPLPAPPECNHKWIDDLAGKVKCIHCGVRPI